MISRLKYSYWSSNSQPWLLKEAHSRRFYICLCLFPIQVCVCVCVCVHAHMHTHAHSFTQSCSTCLKGKQKYFTISYQRADQFVDVQSLDCVWLFATSWTAEFLVLHYLPEFDQAHIHWVGDAIQPYHPVIPFSSCPQSFPASGSFPVNPLLASGGQIIAALASASVFPKNIQGWFFFGLTGLISLLSKGLSRFFLSPQFKSINSLLHSVLYGPTLSIIFQDLK